MNDASMIDSLAVAQPQSAVPQGYAEKAMASLMQLHTELMDEKERRVELYRRLMEREQSIAELKSYTRMLEEKLASLNPPKREEPAVVAAPVQQATPPQYQRPPPMRVVTPPAAPVTQAVAPRTVPPPMPQRAPVAPQRQAVAVGAGRAPARGVPDGWKTW